MKFIDTEIADVKIIEVDVFGDARGFFMETFRADEFMKVTGAKPFVQDNHSKSSKGILRGLHYQRAQTQGKLVRVISGAVFDGSSHFLQLLHPHLLLQPIVPIPGISFPQNV